MKNNHFSYDVNAYTVFYIRLIYLCFKICNCFTRKIRKAIKYFFQTDNENIQL